MMLKLVVQIDKNVNTNGDTSALAVNKILPTTALTLPVPLMKEMRFLQTGRRTRIMLKLIGRAGPRANARAS